MPNSLLLLVPPAPTMCHAAGTAPHTEIKYCEDTRPGQQLEAAQQQHADLCKNTCGTAVMLHTILLGVGGTCSTEHTLKQFEQLGLDHQRAIKPARKLHAHFVPYANKLVTIKRDIKNNNTSHSQVLEPGASTNPPNLHSHFLFCSFVVKGTHGSSEPVSPFP
eukprot:1141278-Pelagomonas_calceolata.AAC.4